MSVEHLAEELREKIETLGFTSTKFQYALINERGLWKIYAMRVLFDYTGNAGEKNVLINEPNFKLEDYWLSLEQFYAFLEYLKTVDVASNQSTDNLFKLGDYELSFKGNFPGGTISFLRSQLGRDHGLHRAFYFTQYYFHGSAKATAYQITLTHHDPPFLNVVEAINYYWKTNYDTYSMGTAQLGFYLPLVDASIKVCDLTADRIDVDLDIDYNRVSDKELTLAVIAQGMASQYRRKHDVSSDSMCIDLGFEPLRFTVTLNKGATTLDEYHYYKQEPETIAPPDAVERYLTSYPQTRKHIIFVDAGFKPGKGGKIAWFNETTGEIFHRSQECPDSFRCEYEAVAHALQNFKDFRNGEEVEIRSDNVTVVRQLAHEYAINDEDTLQKAIAIWDDVAKKFHGKVKFVHIPREVNKAGKLLGS